MLRGYANIDDEALGDLAPALSKIEELYLGSSTRVGTRGLGTLSLCAVRPLRL